MTVTYREVPGFSRYKVSEFGEILGRRGRPIKLETLDGYLTLKALSDEGKLVRVGAHQFVALAFIGPKPSALHQVAHGDGVRTNNTAGNLKWATQGQNEHDKQKHGTGLQGERHHRARLTREQASSIRSRYRSGEASASLAAEYGVSQVHVRQIADGRKWSSLPAGDPVASLPAPTIAAGDCQRDSTNTEN